MWSQIISSSSQTPKMAILPSDNYCLMTIFLPCPEVVIISNTHCTCNPSNTFIPIWLLQNTSVAHGGFWLSEAHPRLFAFLFFVWLHPCIQSQMRPIVPRLLRITRASSSYGSQWCCNIASFACGTALDGFACPSLWFMPEDESASRKFD